MGLRNYKDFIEHMKKNDQAGTMVDVIGKKATKALEEMVKTGVVSWLDVTDVMKEKFNLTGFQLGMLLGYFNGYQAAMNQYGIVVGGRQ
jgi:hypothetical protein